MVAVSFIAGWFFALIGVMLMGNAFFVQRRAGKPFARRYYLGLTLAGVGVGLWLVNAVTTGFLASLN